MNNKSNTPAWLAVCTLALTACAPETENAEVGAGAPEAGAQTALVPDDRDGG